MKVKLFALPYDGERRRFDDGALVDFLASRDVLSVAEHFFVHEQIPTWGVLVTWRDHAVVARGAGEPRRDHRAELDPADAALYDTLRSWRAALARRDGIPVYNITHNRQLAEIARRRPTTVQELATVEGLGEARVRSFGGEVLSIVAAAGRAEQGSGPADGGPQHG